MDESAYEVKGQVLEALPGLLFRIAVADENDAEKKNGGEKKEKEILAYLSGRMRLKRIRVLVGDWVIVHCDKYGGKGRIIQRL